MRLPIPEQERRPLARFMLAFASLILAWAFLHDLYLIGLEPRHFTEYHRPLLPLERHGLLALQYASVATLGPGLAFGFLAWLACRAGARAPVQLSSALGGFVLLLIAMEVLLLALGALARARLAAGLPPLYPTVAYPDLTPGIVVTQTINLSAYLVAPAAGALYLLLRFLNRARPMPN